MTNYYLVVAHPDVLSDAGTREITEHGHAARIYELIPGEDPQYYEGIDYAGDEDEQKCKRNLDAALLEAGWQRISGWTVEVEDDDALTAFVKLP